MRNKMRTDLKPQHGHLCGVLHLTHGSSNAARKADTFPFIAGRADLSVSIHMHGIEKLPGCCGCSVAAVGFGDGTQLIRQLPHGLNLHTECETVR